MRRLLILLVLVFAAGCGAAPRPAHRWHEPVPPFLRAKTERVELCTHHKLSMPLKPVWPMT